MKKRGRKPKKLDTITENYKRVLVMLEDGLLNQAEEILNWGIAYLAKKTGQVQHIDGVELDRWKERYWTLLEDNNMMEDGDVDWIDMENE
jgi:hypothetical protein